MRHAAILLLTSVFLFGEFAFGSQAVAAETVCENTEKETADSPGSLYALSAVLMDGESGRILYEKDGETPRPNASTTKVMTCILALENGAGDDYVMVSDKAAAQPDVQLGMREGEQYYLEDLLYSLMLMSHNDTAVAIAEHIGGSTEGFAGMMNEKAKEIGCTDTYFITPNGLDAEDEKGVHHTTARDLALIMRYAIRSETFLKITQTREYSFTDLDEKREFSVHNTNALLTMTDGVLSGKTGFTGDAGYCYVCACEKDEKTFVVSLLGCGWPNNKGYKWKDSVKLLDYGEDNFDYEKFWKELKFPEVPVKDGVEKNSTFGDTAVVSGIPSVSEKEKNKKILMKKGEKISCRLEMPEKLQAPVKKGNRIGTLIYSLGEEELASYPVLADRNVEKVSYGWCVDQVFHDFFH